MGIEPEKIKDVEDWTEAYTQAEYIMKVERLTMYSAVKQAMVEVVNEMFKKDGEFG